MVRKLDIGMMHSSLFAYSDCFIILASFLSPVQNGVSSDTGTLQTRVKSGKGHVWGINTFIITNGFHLGPHGSVELQVVTHAMHALWGCACSHTCPVSGGDAHSS